MDVSLGHTCVDNFLISWFKIKMKRFKSSWFLLVKDKTNNLVQDSL